MSRLLSELLGSAEPGFSLLVKQLERAGGHPSADVRLTAEIAGNAQSKNRILGLDAHDTNGPELYHSLLLLAEKHDRLLRQSLGSSSADDGHNTLLMAKTAVNRLSLPDGCWALKRSTAKKLLKAMPPRNVMKHLGYRSLDSLLKRENTAELYGALCFLESGKWLERFTASYKTLTSADFESRQIEIVGLPRAKWGDVAADYARKQHSNLIGIRIMGAIVVLPLPGQAPPGLLLATTSLMAYYIRQIRMYSVYCKLHQVKADFGALAGRALTDQPDFAAELAGNLLPWPVLLYHFGNESKRQQAAVFEPHVQHEDVSWRPVADVIGVFDPELEFWQSTDYLGASYPEGVVTYNLLDVSLNYCNNIPYSRRVVYHMREALWYELYARYLAQEVLERDILGQLEANILEAEPTSPKRNRKA